MTSDPIQSCLKAQEHGVPSVEVACAPCGPRDGLSHLDWCGDNHTNGQCCGEHPACWARHRAFRQMLSVYPHKRCNHHQNLTEEDPQVREVP